MKLNKDIFNLKFNELTSYNTDSVRLLCTDGTWIQLEFYPTGPQILNLNIMEDGRLGLLESMNVENYPDMPEYAPDIKKMFTPFFSQNAEDSGIDKEIFTLTKAAFERWCCYEELVNNILCITTA